MVIFLAFPRSFLPENKNNRKTKHNKNSCTTYWALQKPYYNSSGGKGRLTTISTLLYKSTVNPSHLYDYALVVSSQQGTQESCDSRFYGQPDSSATGQLTVDMEKATKI